MNIQALIIILTIYAAKIGLRNISPLALLERWRTTIKAMDGNAYFPDPEPTLAQQTAMCNKLETAIQQADRGDHNKIKHRNTVFAEAKDMFRLMVWYVNLKAQGNREIIRSAKLEEKKGRGPSHVPGQVQGLKAVYYGVAKIKLLWKFMGNNIYYSVEYTTDPVNGTWIKLKRGTFASKYVVYDLTPGVLYFFRVIASNSLGAADPSEVANFRCG